MVCNVLLRTLLMGGNGEWGASLSGCFMNYNSVEVYKVPQRGGLSITNKRPFKFITVINIILIKDQTDSSNIRLNIKSRYTVLHSQHPPQMLMAEPHQFLQTVQLTYCHFPSYRLTKIDQLIFSFKTSALI